MPSNRASGIRGARRRRILTLLLIRDGPACCWCGVETVSHVVTDGESAPPDHTTIEHLVPASWGGFHDISNLAIACRRCNQRRGDKLPPPDPDGTGWAAVRWMIKGHYGSGW